MRATGGSPRFGHAGWAELARTLRGHECWAAIGRAAPGRDANVGCRLVASSAVLRGREPGRELGDLDSVLAHRFRARAGAPRVAARRSDCSIPAPA
jgi:hypothetical protein